ncbi:hypothetical protein Tco_0830216 [Tanacetum coccineum]
MGLAAIGPTELRQSSVWSVSGMLRVSSLGKSGRMPDMSAHKHYSIASYMSSSMWRISTDRYSISPHVHAGSLHLYAFPVHPPLISLTSEV